MKTLLVVLLLLVFSTGTAFAECAWVLWIQESVDLSFVATVPVGTTWTLDVARQTQAECEDVLRRVWENRLKHSQPGPDKPGIKDVKSTPGFIAVTLQGADGGVLYAKSYTFRCLPDTIDPRGPKGK